jgi:hypothetical protein
MLLARIKGDREYAYPWAAWGARAWLRWSGMKIRSARAGNLAPDQSYVLFPIIIRILIGDDVRLHGKKMGVIAKRKC